MCSKEKLIFCYEIYGLELKIAEGETITGYTIKEGGKILPSLPTIFDIPHGFHSILGSNGTIWDRGIAPWSPYGYINEASIAKAKREKKKLLLSRRSGKPRRDNSKMGRRRNTPLQRRESSPGGRRDDD